MGLNIQSPIPLHGIALNVLSTETTLTFMMYVIITCLRNLAEFIACRKRWQDHVDRMSEHMSGEMN
jgi:hypothetical protein